MQKKPWAYCPDAADLHPLTPEIAPVKKTNHSLWKQYSLEFLSVFVAVIMAFALNNWNENRKSNLAEDKILTEIYNGLEKDLFDISMNVSGHQQGLAAANFFRRLLGDQPASTDSFLYHYLNLTRDFVSIQNTSGYETLKSRGLELIKNDSLRSAIISLYEYDFETLAKLEEDYYEIQFQENYFKDINSMLSPFMVFNTRNELTGLEEPINLTGLDKNLFLSYLWKIDVNRNFILIFYRQVKEKIQAIKSRIQEEIDLQ